MNMTGCFRFYVGTESGEQNYFRNLVPQIKYE